MKERPILFSAEMVRAILEGRKTQTRRIVKDKFKLFERYTPTGETVDYGYGTRCGVKFSDTTMTIPCPYGKPGDRLWVRETWTDANSDDGPVILYKADYGRRYLMHEEQFMKPDPKGYCGESFDYSKTGNLIFSDWAGDIEHAGKGYKPSIHMPRWASRIDLEITGIRVERLQDISEEDARKEGVLRENSYTPAPLNAEITRRSDNTDHLINPPVVIKFKEGFKRLWKSINGAESWDTNPWVWIIEFKQVRHDPA